MSDADNRRLPGSEDQIIKQRKYDEAIERDLARQTQETQRQVERQRQYTQEDADRLKQQTEQSQQQNK